jgi:hypothetical protein
MLDCRKRGSSLRNARLVGCCSKLQTRAGLLWHVSTLCALVPLAGTDGAWCLLPDSALVGGARDDGSKTLTLSRGEAGVPVEQQVEHAIGVEVEVADEGLYGGDFG